MKKALVITDFNRGFHNYREGVDEQLHEVFSGLLEIDQERQDIEGISLQDMLSEDCLILYCAPVWDLKADSSFMTDLMDYLVNGGRILLLHIMSFGGTAEGAGVFGGSFRMHPPYNRYRILPAKTNDSILQGVAPFEIEDELHLLHMSQLLDKKVLLYGTDVKRRKHAAGPVPYQDIYAREGGLLVPLSWYYTFGKGKVVYACPGHNAQSFQEQIYVRFLRNCMEWLLTGGQEGGLK